jgi:hypothetical protein
VAEIAAGLLIFISVCGLLLAFFFVKTYIVGGRTDAPVRQRRAPTVGDRNKEKGRAGEAAVTRILQELPVEHYELFTTVILPKQPDRSGVEMDHVVLSRFGIFVVETKSWGGRLDGEVEGEWLQTIGRQFHTHPNPYAQNDRQVRRLRQHLGISSSAIRGIVCFAGDATLGPNVPPNVVHGSGLLAYISRFQTEQLNADGLAELRRQLAGLARSHR